MDSITPKQRFNRGAASDGNVWLGIRSLDLDINNNEKAFPAICASVAAVLVWATVIWMWALVQRL